MCCINNGFCCVDEFDLNGNGNTHGDAGAVRSGHVRVRSALAAATLALGAVAAAPAARADSCGKPDLVDMVPPDGATGVPLNARLGAHYAAAAEYLGEDVVLVHPDGSEQLLDATWDATEQLLQVTPTAPLDRTACTRSAGPRCAA